MRRLLKMSEHVLIVYPVLFQEREVVNIQKEFVQKLEDDLADIREMAGAFVPFILLDDLYRILDGNKPINELMILKGS